jgi:hypothetical protein
MWVSNKFTKRTYYSIEIDESFSMVIFFSKINVRKQNIDTMMCKWFPSKGKSPMLRCCEASLSLVV